MTRSRLRTRLGRLKLTLLSALWLLRHYRPMSAYFRTFDLGRLRAYKLASWHFDTRCFTARLGDRLVFIKTTPVPTLIAREVRAIEALSAHPDSSRHVPKLLAHAFADTSYPFIALEFIDATPLEPSFAYSTGEKRTLFAHLRVLLESLHRDKLVHRDILPRNLLVEGCSDTLRLILIDFSYTVRSGAEGFPDHGDAHSLLRGLGKDLKPAPFVWDDAYSIREIMKLIDEHCAETFSEQWEWVQGRVGQLSYHADLRSESEHSL